ncbi:DUF2513 domain-containing protein [Citrobacter sp. Igbk 14]|uniref:DUF2513 domain-containing protein n=1 Tax=Citrobacter sp. Igbk 14 TaxID=2963960 RepID=UPI0023032944|nr:DUF2513 domain-containing protein [Citrobacter sp. Igbk 14]MDA8510931.1 DUF2513 domain-containing protein [Citrobacter sp. Igbk 14]
MKIDLDEMKRLLNVFLESPKPYVTITELGVIDSADDSDKVIAHLLLMAENGFISSLQLETGFDSLGLRPSYGSSGVRWNFAVRPIRLTQSGHDFASVLNQRPVFERLKEEAQEAPVALLRKVGSALTEKLLKEKLGLGD